MRRRSALLGSLCWLSLPMLSSASPGPRPVSPPADLVAAAKGGDAEAQDRLGAWYDDRGDGKTALVWYRKAADAGSISGAHHVGVMLEGGAEGHGAPQDCRASRERLMKASSAGYAASTFRIGYQFYRGVCAEKDYAEARAWFVRSGTPAGIFQLGLMAEFGQGQSVDLAQAGALYEKAYAASPVPAWANQRAHLFYDARPQDAESAYLWYLRGVADADGEDAARLKELRRRLPEETRLRIESRSRRR